MINTDLKILALDIETSPALVWTFGLFNQNIGIKQIKEHPRIIAYSAQWYGSKKILFQSEYHDSPDLMLAGLHTLLDEADVVVGWNSDGFDLKWIEGEFQLAGMLPPAPYLKMDLMKHFRRRSRFISKKLDYVSERMLSDNKINHDGFEMWRACIDPEYDPALKKRYWNKMRVYAKKDTALLFPIMESVQGWLKWPTAVFSDPTEARCRKCGGNHLQWRGTGYARTQERRYRQYQCQNPECGAWGRVTVSEGTVSLTRDVS